MNHKRITFIILATGVLLVIGSVFLMTVTPVKAQCGSQASSCKNCHETQAQFLVNADGTVWHTQHAFGDFCYLCHGGNSQTTDKVAAHTGMVDPLSDINLSCKNCHPTDTLAKAQVIANELGKQVGVGGTEVATSDAGLYATPVAAPAIPASSGSVSNVPATIALAVDDPNLVNFTQRYDEIVLGKHPVNWGNVILIAMILLFAVGGGGFVLLKEKLVKVSFGDTTKAEGEFPRDVVDMLPVIAGLRPQARKSLRSILNNHKKTEKVLGLIDVVVSDEKTEE